MDIQSLSAPPPPLTREAARQWLQAFQRAFPKQGQPAQAWEQDLQSCIPTHLGDITHLAGAFVEWIDENGLREPAGEGMVLSLKGVSVVVSSDLPRRSPSQAWQHAAKFLAAAKWVNDAPALVAPMRIADVLLFGSMTEPNAVDHGDMDVVVLFEPKEPGAGQECERFLSSHGLDAILRPNGLSFPSFRRGLVNFLGDMHPFVSVDDHLKTLEVLLDANPDFACYSLLKKTWDVGMLERTTADEEAGLVMQALENGLARPAVRAHIARRLSAANAELGLDSPTTSAAWVLASGLALSTDKPKEAIWWASLNPTPPMGSIPAMGVDVGEQWQSLKDAALGAWSSSEHPHAQVLADRWSRGLSGPSSSPTQPLKAIR